MMSVRALIGLISVRQEPSVMKECTKPWVGCFLYILTGRKPYYDLPESASVKPLSEK